MRISWYQLVFVVCVRRGTLPQKGQKGTVGGPSYSLWTNPATWHSMLPLGNLPVALAMGLHLCRRPSSLGRDALPTSGTSASPARACGFACLRETLQNIACAQGLGVWGWAWAMLQRCLVCIIETSWRIPSKKLRRAFWRQTLPGMPAMLGPCSTKRRKCISVLAKHIHQVLVIAFCKPSSLFDEFALDIGALLPHEAPHFVAACCSGALVF